GQVWSIGFEPDAAALFEGREARLVTLPPSPLDTFTYWPVERPLTPAEPLRLPSGAQEMTQMDPLVALFREQVALLQQQAKVLEQQAAALAGKGIAVPQLAAAPSDRPMPAIASLAPKPVPAPAPVQLRPAKAAAPDER